MAHRLDQHQIVLVGARLGRLVALLVPLFIFGAVDLELEHPHAGLGLGRGDDAAVEGQLLAQVGGFGLQGGQGLLDGGAGAVVDLL